MTNFERIKSASLEEIAKIICETHVGWSCCDACIAESICSDNYIRRTGYSGIVKWLEQEFKESKYKSNIGKHTK